MRPGGAELSFSGGKFGALALPFELATKARASAVNQLHAHSHDPEFHVGLITKLDFFQPSERQLLVIRGFPSQSSCVRINHPGAPCVEPALAGMLNFARLVGSGTTFLNVCAALPPTKNQNNVVQANTSGVPATPQAEKFQVAEVLRWDS